MNQIYNKTASSAVEQVLFSTLRSDAARRDHFPWMPMTWENYSIASSEQFCWSSLLLTSGTDGVSFLCQSYVFMLPIAHVCQNNVPCSVPWVVKRICYSEIQASMLVNKWKYNAISVTLPAWEGERKKKQAGGCHRRRFSPWPGCLAFLCAVYNESLQRESDLK